MQSSKSKKDSQIRNSRRSFLKNTTIAGVTGALYTGSQISTTSAQEENNNGNKNSPKGMALAIGLNEVDPGHYSGWSGELNACERDANLMESIAKDQNFSNVTKILTKNATREKVFSEIEKASNQLNQGDIFVVSYSGHGGQLPDRNQEEVDRLDETWCLFDGQVIDDELDIAWSQFKRGVRILVISDSCHSGTVTKTVFYQSLMNAYSLTGETQPVYWPKEVLKYKGEYERSPLIFNNDLAKRFESLKREPDFLIEKDRPHPEYRFMPLNISYDTYKKNRGFYDSLIDKMSPNKATPQASVLLISGCQDNQVSMDGWEHGQFTGQLKKVWNDGNFEGSYRDFHAAILNKMPATQSPNYFFSGAPNPEFENQKPFTI